MRRLVPAVAATCLLAGPTALAFFSGAYFAEPRLVGAMVAWLLVLILAVAGPLPLPRSFPGRLALGGLVLMTVWSAISVTWAPLRGPAVENVERLVLYVGALLVAAGALRTPRAMRAVEPLLGAGATVVIGYGLAGRLLPGIIHLSRSTSAHGRLEQPITYWNGEGALAAVGLVLCARMVGDRTRPLALRAAAAGMAVPLSAGVYLSYSRGAIVVALLGMVILVAAAPSRAQLRAVAMVLGAGVIAAVCSSAFPGFASLHGLLSDRERDGAIMLAILVALTVVSALLAAWRSVVERRAGGGDQPLPGARRLGVVAAALVVVVAVGLVVGGLREKGETVQNAGPKATRLTSASSNRYEYWSVGLRAFRRHPLEGLGAAGFRVFWLQERKITEPVLDVHSLELEMAAELGLVGLLALGLLVAGVTWAARVALRRDATMAAGWCAAVTVWFLHASIDWDWQLPAVTLPAIALAGALIALADPTQEPSVAPRSVGAQRGEGPPAGWPPPDPAVTVYGR